MIRWVVGIVAGTVALYYLTGGGRASAVAEGKTWRLSPGASAVKDWAKIYPDAVPRLSAARALVTVKIVNKRPGDGGAGEQPVAVRIDGIVGPKTFRGHFEATKDIPLPRPWGPDDGAILTFDLADVFFIVED